MRSARLRSRVQDTPAGDAAAAVPVPSRQDRRPRGALLSAGGEAVHAASAVGGSMPAHREARPGLQGLAGGVRVVPVHQLRWLHTCRAFVVTSNRRGA